MSTINYLVEFEALTPGGQVVTCRACLLPHTTRQSENPPDTYYEDRLQAAPSFSVDMFGDLRSGGRAKTGYGVCTLINNDHGIDAWTTYSVGGRPFTLRVGPVGGAYPGDFPVVFSGVMTTIRPDANTITITLRDRVALVDNPVSATTYAGSNVLPAGVEGVEDIKGKNKPRLFGRQPNINPICVNTSKLIYQAFEPQNLLMWSEDFTNAVWATSGNTITQNAVMAPDGTMTADLVNSSGASIYQVVKRAGNTTNSFGIYFKPGTASGINLYMYQNGSASPDEFRILFTAGSSSTSGTIAGKTAKWSNKKLNNGWYLFTIENAVGSNADNSNVLYMLYPLSGTFYIWGACLNAGPVCLPYVPTASGGSITAVYDRGVPLTAGAVYASQSDMEATAPTAGQYRVWPQGGMIRLGSKPAGTVTLDAQSALSSALMLPSALIRSAAHSGTLAGTQPPQFVQADLDALDAAWLAQAGAGNTDLQAWISDSTTAAALLDKLTQAVGAWWGFDRLGQLRVGRLTAPSGATALDLTTLNLAAVTPVSPGEIGGEIPVWRVLVHYDRNATPQKPADLGGDATSASDPVGGVTRRAWLSAEYRDIEVKSTATQQTYPLAPDLERTLAVASAPAAQAEASRLQTLFGVPRVLYQAEWLITSQTEAQAVDIGTMVNLVWPYYGLSAGKSLVVIHKEAFTRPNTITLYLWG